jgi:hypothetical protein
MRVTDIRKEDAGDGVRLAARFVWEDAGLPPEEVAFEVGGGAAEDAVATPEAFGILGALAAVHVNERRLRIEESLCPQLAEGLRTAVRLLRAWYAPGVPAPTIEASRGFRSVPPATARAALFLSGGVDSLFVLQRNRENYPADHPASFRDAIWVRGFGARGGHGTSPHAVNLRERQRRCLRGVTEAVGLRLIVVRGSVEILAEDGTYFFQASHSAHLAAVAHLFPRRLTAASIAPSYDAAFLPPWGSHPLLDACYGSSAIEIRHETYGESRAQRTAAVGRNGELLRWLVVCGEGPLEPGRSNCGRCEKCVRTMLGLLLADALDENGPFAAGDVDPLLLESIRLPASVIPFWNPLVEPLRRHGRADLAARAAALVADSRRERSWFDDAGWKGRLRALDRRLFLGKLLAARRALSGSR